MPQTEMHSFFHKITRDAPGCQFLKTLAYGLSKGYFLGLKLHQGLYEKGWLSQKAPPCPTISIGNLVVGGTGKTTFTIFLARLFKEMGKRVMVVTRGYKGKIKQGIISDGKNIFLNARAAGDEGYLLAQKLKGIPVIKGEKRSQAINAFFKDFSPQVIILDDAFQHYALKRDLDIVLLNACCPFSNGYLFPRGRLREPITALKRAQAVVITQVKNQDQIVALKEFLKEKFPSLAIFTASTQVEKIVSWEGREVALATLFHKRFLAFCGLGAPAHFYETLTELNLSMACFLSYPDHHHYTKKDVLYLREVAKKKQVDALITSEKDLVKLYPLCSLLTEARYGVFYPSINIHLHQKEAFVSWLKERLRF